MWRQYFYSISLECFVTDNATEVTQNPGANASVTLEQIVHQQVVEDIKHAHPGSRICLEVALTSDDLWLRMAIVLAE